MTLTILRVNRGVLPTGSDGKLLLNARLLPDVLSGPDSIIGVNLSPMNGLPVVPVSGSWTNVVSQNRFFIFIRHNGSINLYCN